MYASIAIALAAGLAVVFVGLACCYERVVPPLRRRLGRRALCAANQAVFEPDERRSRCTIHSFRAWLLLSAITFGVFGVADGAIIRNQPAAIAEVAGYGALALATTSVVFLGVFSYFWLFPGLRAYVTLNRCGFRSLWVLPESGLPRVLSEDLLEEAAHSKRMTVVDVLGFELFVQGAGGKTGLLRTLIDRRRDIPISVLLLNPLSQELDPDRRMITVYQSIVSELGLDPATYTKRLRATLSTIAQLNEERPESGQIDVRFYGEKPTMRAVIFDDAMMVCPWGPHIFNADMPCLEIRRRSDAPSFYETFRRDAARLWKNAVSQVMS